MVSRISWYFCTFTIASVIKHLKIAYYVSRLPRDLHIDHLAYLSYFDPSIPVRFVLDWWTTKVIHCPAADLASAAFPSMLITRVANGFSFTLQFPSPKLPPGLKLIKSSKAVYVYLVDFRLCALKPHRSDRVAPPRWLAHCKRVRRPRLNSRSRGWHSAKNAAFYWLVHLYFFNMYSKCTSALRNLSLPPCVVILGIACRSEQSRYFYRHRGLQSYLGLFFYWKGPAGCIYHWCGLSVCWGYHCMALGSRYYRCRGSWRLRMLASRYTWRSMVMKLVSMERF